jgi:glycosyltransferase involved in cell wall biosynthesis
MNQKPAVIIFSTFYEPWMSGAERCVKEVVERLTPRYHFVLFTARISRTVPAWEKREGYEIRRVGVGHKQLDKWLFCVLAPFAALRVKTTVVHAVMESYAGIALWVFGLLKPRVARILTLQSGDLDSVEKQQRIPHWLWKKIHTTPHKVTAISHFLAARAERLGAGSESISVVPNGVDLSHIKPRDPSQCVPYRIVCVARLSWEKGLPHLLDALVAVRKKIPDAHLVLVGDGVLRETLAAQVARLDLRDAVTFRGKLPNSEALAVMQTGHVFVCPSLAEGLGIVFIEAQAAGVPVIGTAVGGIPDVIADGETGLLVPPKDAEALARAIEHMLLDQSFAARCVEEALRRLPRFDWVRIIETFDALYQRVRVPRVLLATSIYPPDIGGPASVAAQFVAAWTGRGHRVEVVAPGRNTVEKNHAPTTTVFRGPQGKRGYFLTLFRAAKQADVVFAQDASSYSVLALLVARLRRLPFVVRLGGDLLWERDAASGKTALGISAYYGTGAWKRAAFLHRLMLRAVLRVGRLCLFPNALLPTLYRHAFGISLSHATIVQNPLPATAVARVPSPKRQLVLSGRMTPLKNFVATLDALALVQKEYAMDPFSVLLIGDGPLRGVIEGWKQEQHADWLRIESSMDRETLFATMAASWGVLQLSWAEVSPNIALEALSVCVPVLLTKDTGLAAALAPYATLVDPTDAPAVQAALKELLREEGRARAVERAAKFSWSQTMETMVDQYETVFVSLRE